MSTTLSVLKGNTVFPPRVMNVTMVLINIRQERLPNYCTIIANYLT